MGQSIARYEEIHNKRRAFTDVVLRQSSSLGMTTPLSPPLVISADDAADLVNNSSDLGDADTETKHHAIPKSFFSTLDRVSTLPQKSEARRKKGGEYISVEMHKKYRKRAQLEQ